ncbi:MULTISPECIES: hypothetical protein [unclassified Streptomyces]|uniref:RNA polymerase sigma factor n=1 Tax=unclassified Streptomyces TaxID=2593676 RepID=UPI002ED188DB|nr:hypothetical protein OH827_32895 [Streptomyces sp. NBC_00891]WSY09538.1 hypothetical protein OG464_32900 [Streptomyces sp. NBC_00890]WSZ11158.1 hypothetical protein OG704_32900 [Streptomyces sp. NBC_00869]WSZ21336.1 hypothetical protein OG498_00665 [Streptomyces sp. NBC_00870]
MQEDSLGGPPSRTPSGPPTTRATSDDVGPPQLFQVQIDENQAALQEAMRQAVAADAERADEDSALYKKLAETEFSGISWELFAHDLAAYAHPIMLAWFYTGEVFANCAKRGRPVRRRTDGNVEVLRSDHDEREGLVCEAIARGLRVFREHALVGGGWCPNGGASLKTYFVGAVLGEFGGVFDRWASERARHPECSPEGEEALHAVPAPEAGPEAQAIGHDVVQRLLGQVKNDETRTALFLSMRDYTMQEIGEHLQMSAAAVSMRLSRLRKNPPRQQGGPPEESGSSAKQNGMEDA